MCRQKGSQSGPGKLIVWRCKHSKLFAFVAWSETRAGLGGLENNVSVKIDQIYSLPFRRFAPGSSRARVLFLVVVVVDHFLFTANAATTRIHSPASRLCVCVDVADNDGLQCDPRSPSCCANYYCIYICYSWPSSHQ